VLAARAAAGSVPGRRDDGYRLALVIEGGGSRAAFCSGMALAVERHGVLPCFDGLRCVWRSGYRWSAVRRCR
jgi:hypothetical protein